ncbi:MAG TPA: RidA family protein [Burkholderiales bacterium]|nr:RidA family protein [Burkholderiales bacterium]
MRRQVITAAGAPSPMAHYSQGILAGETLYAAGQIASDYKTGVAPEARQDPAFPYYGSEIQKQARYVLENLRAVYREAGLELADTVKAQVFLTDLNDFHYFDQVWKQFFPSPPPRTTVQVSGLLVPGCRIEIDLTAVKRAVEKRVVKGATTPTPLAHYTQGVVAGDTLYAAGQIASDYKTGVPAGPSLARQTRYVLENIASVYKAAGLELADTVKAQVFVTEAKDLKAFDMVWKKFFPAAPPRTVVQVGALLVPGCKIEIDLIACAKGVKRKRVEGGMLAGETLYCAAHSAPEARQDRAFPYYGSDIQKQARAALENALKTYRAAGCAPQDTVKAQVFIAELGDFFYFDQVWKEFFPSPPPRTTVQVSSLLAPGCRVAFDLTAAKT